MAEWLQCTRFAWHPFVIMLQFWLNGESIYYYEDDDDDDSGGDGDGGVSGADDDATTSTMVVILRFVNDGDEYVFVCVCGGVRACRVVHVIILMMISLLCYEKSRQGLFEIHIHDDFIEHKQNLLTKI